MNKWKTREKKMVESIKTKATGLNDLKWMSQNNFCRFDAANEIAIVECKYRKHPYIHTKIDTTLIELAKANALMNACGDRNPIYAVQSIDNIFLFDLRKLFEADYSFGWSTKGCNATSEFEGQKNNGKRVPKKVGYINWDAAYEVLSNC